VSARAGALDSLGQPGLTDTPAYDRLFQFAVWGPDGVPRYTAEMLREVSQLREAADVMMVRLARQMRQDRYTWEEVGQALGMTRQGAQRFLQRHDLDI